MRQGLIFHALLLFLLVAGGLTSCGGGAGFERTNLSYLYDYRSLAPRPNFVVYNLDDSTSRVYYRLSGEELLYMRTEAGSQYSAQFEISYKLRQRNSDVVLDTASFVVEDQSERPAQNVLVGFFKVRPPSGFEQVEYQLEIKLTDLNRNLQFVNQIAIARQEPNGPMDFLLTDTAGEPIFKNHLPAGVPFKIQNRAGQKWAYLSYYDRKFPLALPPYSQSQESTFELEPDTTFQVHLDSVLYLRRNGFYHFRLDTSQWVGFTIFNFGSSFPYIAKREDMIGPMRYITTESEYEGLQAASGDPAKVREAVETFWRRRSGSAERSKILIASYYGRIQEANVLFSSYLEGWKTDRGIIYTIYGPPDVVYRFPESEAWVYGNENSSLNYYFTFYKFDNPFTDNDYQLNRSPSFRYGWGQAIEAWRSGRVYSSKDIQQEQNESDSRIRAAQRNPYWY